MEAEQDPQTERQPKSATLRLAEEVQRRPFAAAAIVGGAAAATAGAFIGAKALARRNGATEGRPVNAVMRAAITACEAAAAAVGVGNGPAAAATDEAPVAEMPNPMPTPRS